MNVVVVVGNPKPRSRTYAAAHLVAERLTGAKPRVSIDLADLGAALLDWSDPQVTELVSAVAAADLVVVASPTYKASYTGLLKLFLDRISAGALADVIVIPLMLGGDWRHSLAVEVHLKPVLAELGASCPTPGLFLLDSEYEDPAAIDTWLERARLQIAAALGRAPK
jgi:FMN reductase